MSLAYKVQQLSLLVDQNEKKIKELLDKSTINDTKFLESLENFKLELKRLKISIEAPYNEDEAENKEHLLRGRGKLVKSIKLAIKRLANDQLKDKESYKFSTNSEKSQIQSKIAKRRNKIHSLFNQLESETK